MTVVQFELWQLILLLISFFGAVAGFGKVILSQFEKRLDERFTSQEQIRATNARHWDMKFEQLGKEFAGHREEFHKFRVHVAEDYWRREDATRQEVILHSKIDALALKLDNWGLRMQGKNHDD